MRAPILYICLALALALGACNLPSDRPGTPTPTTEVQPLPSLVANTEVPSPTPAASDTPPPTQSPTRLLQYRCAIRPPIPGLP